MHLHLHSFLTLLYVIGPVKPGHRLVNARIAPLNILQRSVQQNLSFSDQNDSLRQRLYILHIVRRQNHRRFMQFVLFFDKFPDGDF